MIPSFNYYPNEEKQVQYETVDQEEDKGIPKRKLPTEQKKK